MNDFNIENTSNQDREIIPVQSYYIDLENACRTHMNAHGFFFNETIQPDGQFHRFSADNHKKKQDEWYIGHTWIFKDKNYLAVSYGSWSNCDTKYRFESWEEDKSILLSQEERNELDKHLKEIESQAEIERKKRHAEAAIEAEEIWRNALKESTTDSHKLYLQLKNIDPYNVRFGKNSSGHESIILPLWNIEGKIRSLQFISVGQPNNTIYKSFLSGGEKKGCFFVIGNLKKTDSFFITEGFATGASVHKADGRPIVIAFDCGNLEHVIAALRTKYPQHQIVIAGDDDIETKDNPGRIKAEAAATKHSCKIVFPKFPQDLKLYNGKKPTDFNDLHILTGIEDVKKQLQENCIYAKEPTDKTDIIKNISISSNEWETPIEFQNALLPVPAFDPNLLPTPIRSHAVDAADRMQCPIDFIAAPQLVMTASLIGAGCAIRPKQHDNWTVIPNLWGGIIEPPSVMKTPALNESMAPIGDLEKTADDEYQQSLLTNKVNIKEIKLRKQAIEKDLKNAIENENESQIELLKTALVSLEKEDSSIQWKRYKTNDATIEKLAEIMADNPRGILMYRDELIGFLVSLDKYGREGDRAFYLEGWNGYSSSSVKSDRIGRGTVACNPCISVLGGIQPSKLRQYLFDTVNDIANDGLFQRFQVLVYPDKPKGFKLIDRKPNYKAREKVIEIGRTLAKTDFLSMGAKIEEPFPIPILRFDPEAQEFFNRWLIQLKERLLNDDDEGIFFEHLSKYPKLMPSLALNNYLIKVAGGNPPSSVSLEDVSRAADQCAYLEAHAKRIYSMVDSKTIVRAKTLLKKLQAKQLPNPFTKRDIYRKEWSNLTNTSDAAEACKELIKRGWLKKEKVKSTSQGGAPTTRYYIHPILKM